MVRRSGHVTLTITTKIDWRVSMIMVLRCAGVWLPRELCCENKNSQFSCNNLFIKISAKFHLIKVTFSQKFVIHLPNPAKGVTWPA